jgi:tripartite-type tricarboxylate transporter receptor subunit TctC
MTRVSRNQLALAVLMLGAASSAAAQGYPNKPIRWLTGAAGGGLDIFTRAFAAPLSKALGQPVITENMPAAGGIIAAETVAKAPPDGYTLLTTGSADLYYNSMISLAAKHDGERDFAPVSGLFRSPLVLFVHASVPASSVQEFIAVAKAHPGKLNYGASGRNHPFGLFMELLKQRTGTDIVFVSYKGTAQILLDLSAGRLESAVYPAASQLVSQVESGKLRALAAATRERLPWLKDVPTFAEAGLKDLDLSPTVAAFTSAGTPREIVQRLNGEIVRAAGTPELEALYRKFAALRATGTPEELREQQRREHAMWGPLIKQLGIKPE